MPNQLGFVNNLWLGYGFLAQLRLLNCISVDTKKHFIVQRYKLKSEQETKSIYRSHIFTTHDVMRVVNIIMLKDAKQPKQPSR